MAPVPPVPNGANVHAFTGGPANDEDAEAQPVRSQSPLGELTVTRSSMPMEQSQALVGGLARGQHPTASPTDSQQSPSRMSSVRVTDPPCRREPGQGGY
jgi:hypothetical protein